MEKVTEATNLFPWDQFFLKMLDWPFLLFVIVAILIFMTKDQINALVNRSNLKITWGDRSIELNELADKVDQDLDPLKERLAALEEQLSLISQKKPPESTVNSKEPTPTKEEINKVINGSLKNNRYKYRTVSGVAKEAKIPETTVQKILDSNPAVRVVTARNGRILYSSSSDTNSHKK